MNNLKQKIIDIFNEEYNAFDHQYSHNNYVKSYVPRTDLGPMVDIKYGYKDVETAVEKMKKLLLKDYWKNSKELFIDVYAGPDLIEIIPINRK